MKPARAMLFATTTFAAFQATPAFAQVTELMTAEAHGVAEVVVTARRRDESLQDVPVAVTALSAEDLERRSVRDLRGIATATPNLVVETNPRSGLAANITLRGQATQNAVITYDSPVGMYVDDVYIARNQGVLGGMFDIRQVQVLRGVQGSLFGRNSNGGAILISTQEPTDRLEGYVAGGLGDYDYRSAEGVLNVPLADEIALRIGFQKRERSGFEFNRTTGERNNSLDAFAARIQLRVAPTDSVESTLRYDHVDADQLPPSTHPDTALGAIAPPADFYESITAAPWEDRLKVHRVSLTTTADLGAVRVKNVLAYHRQRGFTYSDSDGFPLPLNDTQLTENQDQYTAELQFSGDAWADRARWLAGLYYFRETGSSNNFNATTTRDERGDARNVSVAGFVHLEVDVTDRLEVGAGLRRTRDERELRSGRVQGGVCATAASIVAPGTCLAEARETFSYWTYDANVNYRFTDQLHVYARTGRGLKAGGFDVPILAPSSLTPYRPEVARDYEVGLKSEFFDRRMRANFAVYRTDYDDIQRIDVVLVGGSLAAVVRNAAKARISGFEGEVIVEPVRGLSLSGSIGVADARYERFILGGRDISGNDFTSVPQTTYNLAASYTFDMGSLGEMSLHADYVHKSRIEFATVNSASNGQDAYGLLSGRVSFSPSTRPELQIAVFGTNLTDEKYNVGGVALGPFNVLYRGAPMTYGAEVKLRFGGGE